MYKLCNVHCGVMGGMYVNKPSAPTEVEGKGLHSSDVILQSNNKQVTLDFWISGHSTPWAIFPQK